jgi:hypothetical protein
MILTIITDVSSFLDNPLNIEIDNNINNCYKNCINIYFDKFWEFFNENSKKDNKQYAEMIEYFTKIFNIDYLKVYNEISWDYIYDDINKLEDTEQLKKILDYAEKMCVYIESRLDWYTCTKCIIKEIDNKFALIKLSEFNKYNKRKNNIDIEYFENIIDVYYTIIKEYLREYLSTLKTSELHNDNLIIDIFNILDLDYIKSNNILDIIMSELKKKNNKKILHKILITIKQVFENTNKKTILKKIEVISLKD